MKTLGNTLAIIMLYYAVVILLCSSATLTVTHESQKYKPYAGEA